jgi:hypothetical protein
MTIIDPLIICHRDAVRYNCATNKRRVHSKSQNDGIANKAMDLYEMVPLDSFGKVNQSKTDGIIPKNINSNIMIGLAKALSWPSIPVDEVSYATLQLRADIVPDPKASTKKIKPILVHPDFSW